MDRNRSLGVNSGSGKRVARPGSLTRRPTQRFDPHFEPKIEWMDIPDAHVLVAELPGFKKEEVRVQLEGENVIISGGRIIQDQLLREGTWQPRRRTVSRFRKAFTIPKNVDIEGYTSKFENAKMYITFNKLKAPLEVKSSDILDQPSKSIPQVGESNVEFIEELSEKTNDKESRNKLEQSLTDENVETPNLVKSSVTQGEEASNNKMYQGAEDEKVEAPKDSNSSATQDDKASRNKQYQSPRDETPIGAKSITSQDNKASGNDLDQSPRDEKVETSRDAKSYMSQDEKEQRNKPHQIPRDEKVETPGGTNSTMTQDEKQLSNKPHQVLREEMLGSLGGAKYTMAQDEKDLCNKPCQISVDEMFEAPGGAKTMARDENEMTNKPHQIPREDMVEAPKVVNISATMDDKASGNKQEQNQKKEKLETLGVAQTTTTQIEKVSINKPDQIPRDEKVDTSSDPKFAKAQDRELSGKPHLSQRDEMIENKDVAKCSVAQDDRESNNKLGQSTIDKKVQTLEATKKFPAQLEDGKVESPKVVGHNTTQESIQENTQLEASKKLEELAKHPSPLNEERLVNSSTLPNHSELLDSKQEAQMKVGNQREPILNENQKVDGVPLHGDQKEEEESSPKAKKEGDAFDLSQTKEDKDDKEKHYIFKAFTYVPQFISSRYELVVIGIAVFSLGLFISSKLT